MKPSTIRYFIREGLSGLKMNMLMTMASIVAVAACISILSFSYCVGSNLRYMLGQMEDSIGISVFLKGDLSGEQIENMKDEIAKIDQVQSVEYISPSDALVELKRTGARTRISLWVWMGRTILCPIPFRFPWTILKIRMQC